MAWIVLIVCGVLEAVWAAALGTSQGFSRPGPSVVFVLGLSASMAGLAFAMRELPTATARAIRVGIGAVLTTAYAMVFDDEPVSIVEVLPLLGIVGLKMPQ